MGRDTAQVGLPEITLGLIPGSGGTQRLPRLIEPATALAVMLSAQRGITRKALGADEIRRRALLGMANEAALLISEGVALRASDVDVVLAHGYGFPRWKGGPVFWSRNQDRNRLNADLKQIATEVGHGFVLADLDTIFDKPTQ